MVNITIKQAVTEDERKAVFAIRKEAFVAEENLFPLSDRDEHDANALYLIAKLDDVIVGTIRIFPLGPEGVWEMGRIAVLPEYRDLHIGVQLAKESVKMAKSQNCRRLLGIVQRHAVDLFKEAGWKILGKKVDYLGIPHQVMEADFDAEALKE